MAELESAEHLTLALNLENGRKHLERLKSHAAKSVAECRPLRVRGWVSQVSGTIIRAVVPGVRVGELCDLVNPDDGKTLSAEVVGFEEHEALLTPMGNMLGVSNNTEVIPSGKTHQIVVGDYLLGQVVDGLGQPMVEGSVVITGATQRVSVYNDAPNAMTRNYVQCM